MSVDLPKPSNPVFVSTSLLHEEPVYDFHRKTVFSPKKGNSNFIKFCIVRGSFGATSMEHTHPGDEIVFTLAGRSMNNILGKELILGPGQGLAVPPNTIHQTTVMSQEGWQGLSFYCDECPLLARHISKLEDCDDAQMPSFIADSNSLSDQSRDLEKIELFSPPKNSTSFMELYILKSQNKISDLSLALLGETTLYVLSGNFQINVDDDAVVCPPGTAALLPNFSDCRLQIETHKGGGAIIASCRFCPLRVNDSD